MHSAASNLSDERPAAPACSNCGSKTFAISGFVGYTQVYDSGIGKYADYDIDSNSDFATHAVCLDCEADATALFVKHNALDFFTVEPEPA